MPPRSTHRPSRRPLAAIKGDRTLAQPAEQFDVHPNQITSWKAQLEGEVSMFSIPASATERAHPAIDVKSLRACILA
jgi:transposase